MYRNYNQFICISTNSMNLIWNQFALWSFRILNNISMLLVFPTTSQCQDTHTHTYTSSVCARNFMFSPISLFSLWWCDFWASDVCMNINIDINMTVINIVAARAPHHHSFIHPHRSHLSPSNVMMAKERNLI